MGSRERLNTLSDVSLPGNRLLEDSVRWSKQMLAASVQEVEDARLRETNAGRNYHRRSPPWTTCAGSVRGGPTTVAVRHRWRVHRVCLGRRRAVRADQGPSARAARRVGGDQRRQRQDRARGDPDGAVYFGANADPGNTDESSKYPPPSRWSGAGRGQEVPEGPLSGQRQGDEVRGQAGRGQ